MRNYLLDDWQHLHNNCRRLICIILLLYQMIRLSCLSPNGRLVVYPILVLYLCDQKARLDATQRQLDDLLLIREGDRVHVAYPQRRNRSINELTEEHAYEWTRFSKEERLTLFIHFRMPDIVSPLVSGGRRHFSGEEVLVIALTRIATGLSFLAMVNSFGIVTQESTPVFFTGLLSIFSLHFTAKYQGEA